jgi:hypothetical protein
LMTSRLLASWSPLRSPCLTVSSSSAPLCTDAQCAPAFKAVDAPHQMPLGTTASCHARFQPQAGVLHKYTTACVAHACMYTSQRMLHLSQCVSRRWLA